MKILLVLPWEEVGGVTRVVGNLAQFLQSHGHELLFVFPGKSLVLRQKNTCFDFPGFEFRMQGPFGQRHPLISVPVFLILFPITLFQVIRLVWKHKIDVINIHFPEECFVYFAVCSRILGTTLISSIHGADVFRDGRLSGKRPWGLRFILRCSNLIIAPSKRCRDYFTNVFPDLAPKTTFIHGGVYMSQFERLSTECDHRLYGRYVLSVSACKQQKALDVLIRAFKSVCDDFPLLNLVLVGDGPLREELEALAVSLDVKNRIKFVGYKTSAEVLKLLSSCEIFVLPSRFETFGIAILEAMACGRPVIATTAGGIPEIIENGENGILVEPDNPTALAEAIQAVLGNQTLRETIANKGRTVVERKFLFEYTGEAYEAAFYSFSSPVS